MSESVEQLIDLYLHRSATPEEERQLFEAIRTSPEAAEEIRQQMLVSLKLHELRERTEVPPELRSAVLNRIRGLAVEPVPARRPAWFPELLGRLRPAWSYFATAAAAGAAVYLVLLFTGTLSESNQSPIAGTTVTVRDTVLVRETDTVFQKQETVSTSRYASARKQERVAPADKSPERPSDSLAEQETVPESVTPTFAETKNGSRTMENIEQSDYLRHYNSNVSTLELVQLTSDDRIRY